jgi:hypothetical protein
MKRTSTLLLSLLVIANIATIAPVQATPWESFKKTMGKVGTAIKNYAKPAAKLTVGAGLGALALAEAGWGTAFLCDKSINIGNANLIAGLFMLPFVVALRAAAIGAIVTSLPTAACSIWAINSGINDIKKVNSVPNPVVIHA